MKRAWDPDRWTFSVIERSAAVWEATADDNQGQVMAHRSGDPAELLGRCRRDAAELTQRRREAAPRR